MQDQQLNIFLEHIRALIQDRLKSYGSNTNIPGINGSKQTIGLDLQKASLEFASCYTRVQSNNNELRQRAKQVEGSLLVAQAIVPLRDGEVKQLLNELYNLVEKR